MNSKSYISALVVLLLGITQVVLCLPSPHYGAAAVEKDGLIYLIGGRITDPLCFNCPEDYETTFGDLTVFVEDTEDFDTHPYPEMSVARVHHTAVLYDEQIYVFGGAGTNNDIEKYSIDLESWAIVDPTDDGYSWTPLGNRPCGRHSHGAAVVGEYMIIFGGFDAVTGSALNDMWTFHFDSSTWTEVEVDGWKPQARGGFSFHYLHTGDNSTIEGDALILFGGMNDGEDAKFFDDVWAFEFPSMRWRNLSPRVKGPSPRAYHASIIVGDYFIIHGGVLPDNFDGNGIRGAWFYQHDMWSLNFNGNELNWKPEYHNHRTSYPAARAEHVMVQWSQEDAFTIFSGVNNGRETLGDTWTYEFDNHWTTDGEFSQTACWPNYYFPYCILDCSANNWCNGHGVCLHDSTCCCDAGWYGDQCDSNTCQDYRGFDYTVLNEILAPKSLESTYHKLEVISGKLENLRDIMPSLQNYYSRAGESGLQTFASEAFNFYQICLVEDLCEVTECFEDLLGCDEACGDETYCMIGDMCVNNQCIMGEERDCSGDFADNKCVYTWCDEEDQKCKSSTVTCEDDDPCTHDTCDPEKGCVHEDIDCDDSDCCTLDACTDGKCVHVDKCEDWNPCTIDNCNNECEFGKCDYEIEDCCYMSQGQYDYVQPPHHVVPRPLGDPLILTGSQVVPPQTHNNTVEAYFWLKACDCQLIYQIEYHCVDGTVEEGAHIHGLANATEIAGVVYTFPAGDNKLGSWDFCQDGVDADDLKNGNFYIQVYFSTGDVRTQITFITSPLEESPHGHKRQAIDDLRL